MSFSTKSYLINTKLFKFGTCHSSSIVGVGHSNLVSNLALGVGAGIEILKGLLTV